MDCSGRRGKGTRLTATMKKGRPAVSMGSAFGAVGEDVSEEVTGTLAIDNGRHDMEQR